MQGNLNVYNLSFKFCQANMASEDKNLLDTLRFLSVNGVIMLPRQSIYNNSCIFNIFSSNLTPHSEKPTIIDNDEFSSNRILVELFRI